MTGPGEHPIGVAADPVLEAIRGRIADWYGPKARLLSDPVAQHRSWSVHFHADVEGAGGRVALIVKIPLWEEAPDLATALAAGPQDNTLSEYRMLQRIGEMVANAGDRRLTAVRPVAYVEEINAVVTERLDCRPLRALSARRRLAVGDAIGAWLRHFHDGIGEATASGFEASDLTASLGGPGEGSAGLFDPLGEAIAAIREDARGIAGAATRNATTHGDFGPSNILVTPDDRVAVIDPNLVPGPVESELAKLAVAIRTPRSRLLAGIRRGKGMHPLERAVLNGYGEVSADIYGLCRRAAAAARWMEIEADGGGIRRLALPMARRVLASETA
ncbi:MAG: aminoglycoside phosphotransferase family protein [Acidimicrobiia bacterium]|nr:aminoglycoside phosphotransferase family protein [Acidimicrobiia bacterium]